MTNEKAEILLQRFKVLRQKHLAKREEIDIMEGYVHSECDSKKSNAYSRALVEAEQMAAFCPSGRDENGREWIEVEGKRYPKDWLIRTAARMKANKEI